MDGLNVGFDLILCTKLFSILKFLPSPLSDGILKTLDIIL